MTDSTVFIGAIVIAIVQALKEVFPQISGAITTVVAVVVGALVAVLAPHIGVASISVAQGVLVGLAGVGVHTVASKVGTKR
jgi:high-affinity Fe2+/Pb2+ permease